MWSRVARGTPPRRPALVVLVAAMAVLALIPVLEGPVRPALPAPGGSAALHATSTGTSWNNSAVELTLDQPLPSFTVSSTADPRVSSFHAFGPISELTPSGNVSATAKLTGANATWSIVSAFVQGATIVWANVSAPVGRSSGPWGSVDEIAPADDHLNLRANVSFIFTLAAPTSPSADTVRFDLNVTTWPWTNRSDVLGMELDTAAVPSTTLTTGSQPNSVLEVTNSAHAPVALLSWATSATVGYAAGPPANATVTAALNFPSNRTSSALLEFSAPRGGYSELEYDPTVQLYPGAFPPPGPRGPGGPGGGLPTWTVSETAIEAIAASTIAAGLLGAAAYRWRSRDDHGGE